MKLPIVIHPDPHLRKVCTPVHEIDDSIRALAFDLYETMYNAPGIGLAAPQIGQTIRMLVMDCANKDEGEAPQPICAINPEIVAASDETNEHEEGCLSIPQAFSVITRPKAVRVRYWDEHGHEHARDFEGLWATCVQHEIDHLNGKLFIDYISPMRRRMVTQKMKKLKREQAQSG